MNFISPREAVNLIPNDATIVIQGSTSVPTVLLDALTERAKEGGVHGLHLIAGFGVLPGQAPWATLELMDAMHAETIFVPNWLRTATKEGVADTIPCFLGEVPGLFRDGTVPVDVTLLNVSEPDENGYCSFGISADIAYSGQECSRIILAQVNKYMPARSVTPSST